MLFGKFLTLFNEYNKSILRNNQKDILMLILMIINRISSVKNSYLDYKYLKRIYRFFDNINEDTFRSISSSLQLLSDEMFYKWYQCSHNWRRKNPLVITIDDSVIEKSGKHMKCIRHMKNSDGRYVNGFSLLAINVSIGSSPSIPMCVFWHQKDDENSKIKLSSEFIKKWLEPKIGSCSISKNEVIVCFDNWYLCQEMSEIINNLKVCWVSKLKSNWNISSEVSQNSYPVEQYNLWNNYWVVSKMKVESFFNLSLRPQKVFRIWHRSLDICYATQTQTQNGKICLVSNYNFKHKTICKLYRLRWSIEVFFRDLKQSLKLSACHFVEFSKNRFLMELRILVFCILQLLRIQNRKFNRYSVGEVMHQLEKEVSILTKNHHNPLIYLQLHLINKSQTPFKALCNKAYRV